MYRVLYMFLWWVVVLHHQTHHQNLLQVFSSQSPGFALLCNCHRGCSREEKHSNYSNQPQQQRETFSHQAWGKGSSSSWSSSVIPELTVTTDKWEPSFLPLKAVNWLTRHPSSEWGGAVTQLLTVRTAALWGRKWQGEAAEPWCVAVLAVPACTDTVPLTVLGTAVHSWCVLCLVDPALAPRLLRPCRQPPLHLCQPALPQTDRAHSPCWDTPDTQDTKQGLVCKHVHVCLWVAVVSSSNSGLPCLKNALIENGTIFWHWVLKTPWQRSS